MEYTAWARYRCPHASWSASQHKLYMDEMRKEVTLLRVYEYTENSPFILAISIEKSITSFI